MVYDVTFFFRSEGFHSYRTPTYKLHCYETATRLRFVLLTDPSVADLRDTLREIYSKVYVEFVAKNPLQPMGVPITCQKFIMNLDRFIRSLNYFG